MEQKDRRLAFKLRVLHNQIKCIIHRSAPHFEKAPQSQLQGGILGYLYHHQDQPVYQRDIEKEFRISRATATNTLQVMEKNGLIVRKAVDRDARLKRIQMTEEAMQGHKKIEEHMDMLDRRMTEGLSDGEVEELHRLLDVVFQNLEKFQEELEERNSLPEQDGEEERERECDKC